MEMYRGTCIKSNYAVVRRFTFKKLINNCIKTWWLKNKKRIQIAVVCIATLIIVIFLWVGVTSVCNKVKKPIKTAVKIGEIAKGIVAPSTETSTTTKVGTKPAIKTKGNVTTEVKKRTIGFWEGAEPKAKLEVATGKDKPVEIGVRGISEETEFSVSTGDSVNIVYYPPPFFRIIKPKFYGGVMASYTDKFDWGVYISVHTLEIGKFGFGGFVGANNSWSFKAGITGGYLIREHISIDVLYNILKQGISLGGSYHPKF